ncbi:MAG: hypothetical protein B6242_10310 [Anaerolineaceae bacterium 4572_78]|nr:MAG: hypothetical protein B6242_10310 [Anaerolineaceae bacterium 4572_78]
MTYSQFIHGKIIGHRQYKLTAYTYDLANQTDELESIAKKYRFWGQQPPTNKPIAVGVFHYHDDLLLVQAMQATYDNGQSAFDVQGRPFSQHRYMFIPKHDLKPIGGRLWLLLNWIMEDVRNIPVFHNVEQNLAPIPKPHFNKNWYNPIEEHTKLNRSLSLYTSANKSVLLSALAAMLNGQRVVFDADSTDKVYSEDLLEGLLLLLPAPYRTYISIAAGALDEKICTKTNLMVKTNGYPKGELGSDLIWLKRASNEFFGAVTEQTINSRYTELLQPIVKNQESLRIVLRILDNILSHKKSNNHTNFAEILNDSAITIQLIPALPDPKIRANHWQTMLKNITITEWEKIIPLIIDDIGLEIAWLKLQKKTKHKPKLYIPLVFQLWQNFSHEYILYTLQHELASDTSLAENLLRHGLLTKFGDDYHAELLNLSLRTIAANASQNVKQATDLMRHIQENGHFRQPHEIFALQESALPTNLTQDEAYAFFNSEMTRILPILSIADLKAGRIYHHFAHHAPHVAELLESIILKRNRAINLLIDLAHATNMVFQERLNCYATMFHAWQPDFDLAQPLLTDIITQWIATYSSEKRPPLHTVLKPMTNWFERHMPSNLRAVFMREQETYTFEDWWIIAESLFEGLLGKVSFMDHVTAGQPVPHMAQHWLLVCVANPQAKSNFQASYTWHNIKTHGPVWLYEGIAKLLNWQSAGLSELLPIVERMQNALSLPQETIFQLLEALPRRSDSDLGVLLAVYLPQLKTNPSLSVESVPLWQMLNRQAPKVAQIYKILAEEQTNNIAIGLAMDKVNQFRLSGALSEAPEYATAMAHWLHVCGKGNWISGRLLETLVEEWLSQPAEISKTSAGSVDVSLLTSLLKPDLRESYTVNDWIALAKICWLPDYLSLWILHGQPSLSNRQTVQVLNLAKERITLYTQSEQTEKLCVACQNWGLSHLHMAELISQASHATCNFALINPYLYKEGAVIHPDSHVHQNLLALAVQFTSHDEIELTHVKSFLRQLIAQQLQTTNGILFLKTWYQLSVDKMAYQHALTEAVSMLASTHFSILVRCAYKFRHNDEPILRRIVIDALDDYWLQEKQK